MGWRGLSAAAETVPVQTDTFIEQVLTNPVTLIAVGVTAMMSFFYFIMRMLLQIIYARTEPPTQLMMRTNDRLLEQSVAWATQRAETDTQIALLRRDLDWILETGGNDDGN